MQAKLPDINGALVTHRNNMLHAFDIHDYTKTLISWSAMNALLPKEFKVEIDSDKFNNLMAEQKAIKCDKCKEENEFQKITIQNILLSPLDNMLTNKTHEKMWRCLKCDYENIFNQKQINLIKFEEPFYTGIIPDPPERHFGLVDRSTYIHRFQIWFQRALDEIEFKIGKYRAEYMAQMETINDGQILQVEHES